MCDNNMKGVNVETMVTEMYDEWLNGVKFVFELEEKEKEKEKEKAEKRKGQKREGQRVFEKVFFVSYTKQNNNA
ncbi:hypothetical protein RFI_35991, partial [Reticulomyxa filosa]